MPFKSTHGMSKTKIYLVWLAMLNRCRNPSNIAYHNYGGRGISVCERWSNFSAFYEDMGDRPTEKHTIDRVDNDGDYSPANCAWVTRSEQSRNTRRNKLLTANGETKLLCEWAETTGLKQATIWYRLRLGWSEQDAITTPLLRT